VQDRALCALRKTDGPVMFMVGVAGPFLDWS